MKKLIIAIFFGFGLLMGQALPPIEYNLVDSVKATGIGFWGGAASSNLDLIVYGPYIGSETAITENDSLFFFNSTGEVIKSEHIGNTVWAIATTPDGEYTVVGTDNEDILIFHNTVKIAQGTIPGNCCQKRGVAVSPDGSYYGVGGSRFTLHSFKDSNLIPIYNGVSTAQLRAIDFSANNKYVAFGGRFNPQNLTYIALYDLETRALVFSDTLEQPAGANGELRQIAISKNGNRIVAGTFGQENSKIYYYSREDSTSGNWSKKEEISSSSSIYWIDMDDAGKSTVLSTQAGGLKFYSLSDSSMNLKLNFPQPGQEVQMDGGARFVSISPSGEYIVATTRGGGSGGGRLFVLDSLGQIIFQYTSYAEEIDGQYDHPDAWFGTISENGSKITFASNGGYAYFFERKEMTDIENISVLPTVYSLGQNYPNPFNPITTFGYQLSAAGQVELTVYNTLGHKVSTLAKGVQEAGTYSLIFDASNLPTGVYFYRLTVADQFTQVNKMVLLK
ncbi:MAG: T9SS type A sorting domain-containing protein [Candidatus Marinimicrobia bacterium]|nr:T9SS type A sorting domain-containing protein [Candidatus Neomarinimicrobiota bacterium]